MEHYKIGIGVYPKSIAQSIRKNSEFKTTLFGRGKRNGKRELPINMANKVAVYLEIPVIEKDKLDITQRAQLERVTASNLRDTPELRDMMHKGCKGISRMTEKELMLLLMDIV